MARFKFKLPISTITNMASNGTVNMVERFIPLAPPTKEESEKEREMEMENADGDAEGQIMRTENIRNFEDVLEQLGGFGKFQLLTLILLLTLEVPTAFLAFVPVFVGVPPQNWRCISNLTLNETFSELQNVDSQEICEQCPGDFYSATPELTIVSEWNLICSSAWVSDSITSIQMLGMLVGNIYTGSISDGYGRKYTFLGTVLLMAFGQTLSASAPNPYVYAVARFLAGAGFAGYLGLTAIYTMEFHTNKWRGLCGSVGPWGEGVMLLGVLAYYIRPWRLLTWVTTIPFALIIVIFPFVPESPRWLLQNGQLDEAFLVVNKMGMINGKPNGFIPKSVLELVQKTEMGSRPTNDSQFKKHENKGEKLIGQDQDEMEKLKISNRSSSRSNWTYWDLFRNVEYRMTSIYLMIIWLSWSITYFGISYNVKNMAGNPYLNVIFLGLTDAIGYPAGLLLNRLGRRNSVAFFMSWATVFLVGLAVIEIFVGLSSLPPYFLLSLCLAGKFGVSCVRGCMRTLTGESYPTACRSMGVGLCGVAASFGGILAPQLAFLGSRWSSLPYFVFAVISLLGVLVSFLIKDTKGQPMKEENDGEFQNQMQERSHKENQVNSKENQSTFIENKGILSLTRKKKIEGKSSPTLSNRTIKNEIVTTL